MTDEGPNKRRIDAGNHGVLGPYKAVWIGDVRGLEFKRKELGLAGAMPAYKYPYSTQPAVLLSLIAQACDGPAPSIQGLAIPMTVISQSVTCVSAYICASCAVGEPEQYVLSLSVYRQAAQPND
jgi:hypothetical protein